MLHIENRSTVQYTETPAQRYDNHAPVTFSTVPLSRQPAREQSAASRRANNKADLPSLFVRIPAGARAGFVRSRINIAATIPTPTALPPPHNHHTSKRPIFLPLSRTSHQEADRPPLLENQKDQNQHHVFPPLHPGFPVPTVHRLERTPWLPLRPLHRHVRSDDALSRAEMPAFLFPVHQSRLEDRQQCRE